jgi:hypothetical protein
MFTPHNALLVLTLVFIAADAIYKLPSWTWGLCLFLLLLLGR